MAISSEPSPLQPADLNPLASRTWLRITAARFRDPLGWGPGESRFVPPGADWGGIYLGADIRTCFRESVLRDRGLDPSRASLLELSDLAENTCVSVGVSADLMVVDLIAGPLGVFLDTDARSGRRSQSPAGWASAWRVDDLHPAGILYPSRFTGAPCLFVFNHAVPRLEAHWRRHLLRLPDPHGAELADHLRRLQGRSGGIPSAG